MRNDNFKADFCTSCGKLIWKGFCRYGLPVDADIERLEVIDQIKARLAGRQIYRVIKTTVSFSLKVHGTMSIEYYKDPIVLASHTCTMTHLFQSLDDAPDYFPAPLAHIPTPSTHPIPEGFPF